MVIVGIPKELVVGDSFQSNWYPEPILSRARQTFEIVFHRSLSSDLLCA